MKFYKNLIFIIFISVFSFSIIAAESDNVSTDSADFNTGNYEDEIFDPLEPVNRAIFSFNNFADKIILEPAAKGYKKLPSPIQSGIGNFLNNLKLPLVVVNQILQGQGKNAAESSGRFIVNSTAGLFGLIDVAEKIGLEQKQEDFGQTLAVWGVPEGPYIMLPLLGPSTLRDTASRPVSSFLSVTFHMTDTDVNIALKSVDALETRERLLDVESLMSGDKYSFVRDAYMQSMEYEIKDGIDVKDEFVDDMDDFLIDQ